MFKYFSALKATDGFQELIRPMFLHNNDTVAVDVEIKPFPNDLVLKPFASTSTNVLSLLDSTATSFVHAQQRRRQLQLQVTDQAHKLQLR